MWIVQYDSVHTSPHRIWFFSCVEHDVSCFPSHSFFLIIRLFSLKADEQRNYCCNSISSANNQWFSSEFSFNSPSVHVMVAPRSVNKSKLLYLGTVCEFKNSNWNGPSVMWIVWILKRALMCIDLCDPGQLDGPDDPMIYTAGYIYTCSTSPNNLSRSIIPFPHFTYSCIYK